MTILSYDLLAVNYNFYVFVRYDAVQTTERYVAVLRRIKLMFFVREVPEHEDVPQEAYFHVLFNVLIGFKRTSDVLKNGN